MKYTPPEGLGLRDIEAKLKMLQELYQDKRAFLQSELNRQIRLMTLNEQHQTR
jgi:hypothetical protein